MTFTGREMRSKITEDGTLDIFLDRVELAPAADDEIIVRVEAAPINPTDLGLLLGPADISTIEEVGNGDRPALRLSVAPARLAGFRGRLGQSLPVGSEGAGIVVAAGRNSRALEGKRVGMIGGGMYADYRRIKSRDVIPLPAGATSEQGASMFINPLTALGFVETARREGHTAIVHTAAASNLGQMLQKICLADSIPLINIVRSAEQEAMLRAIGAVYVLNSKDDDFPARLKQAVEETGATIAFDAIGGGALGSTILQAMEQAAVERMQNYNRYGSDMFKQLYVYGALDRSPIELHRLSFGFQWSVSGWLLFPFLRKAGREVEERLRRRVADELTTTFASHYTRTISLADALRPDILRTYSRLATGEKFLIDPQRG